MRSTEEDGDSILSSDTGSVKKKRYIIFALTYFYQLFFLSQCLIGILTSCVYLFILTHASPSFFSKPQEKRQEEPDESVVRRSD